jgi:hypothetical protein
MDNDVNYTIGEILEGENNSPQDGNHYIVFFEKLDGRDFVGAMISTKKYQGRNLPMSASHFETHDSEQNQWAVSYRGSYLVPAKLHKFNEMGPFHKVGQLTRDGIEFLINGIGDKPLHPWEAYRNLGN